MRGFIQFIKERGVVGFAVGFIIGGSVTKVVTALVTDIVNPVLGLILSKTKSLESMYVKIAGAKILWGDFVSSLIDFLIIAFIVYAIVKGLRLEKMDNKK